jgi:hypothetical protein
MTDSSLNALATWPAFLRWLGATTKLNEAVSFAGKDESETFYARSLGD